LEGRTLPSTYLVTNTNDSGGGSLRQAILDANNHGGFDTIAFNIPGQNNVPHTIRPTSPLPAVSDPVVIDGKTQPSYGGYPLIEISGEAAGAGANGLVVNAGGCTLRGLVVNRFSADGVVLQGGGDGLYDSYIGTTVDALGAAGNANGIVIASSNNTIGGGSFITVISGNRTNGVYIYSGSGNVIKTSYIGPGLTGTERIGNSGDGVYVASSGNAVGAPGGQANIISGNGYAGVHLAGDNNTLQHCTIGADHSGLVPMSNAEGVVITGNNNFVGGAGGGSNLIGGNNNNGLYVTGKANTIQANSIGDDITGLSPLGNTNGITIEGGSDNVIGGQFGVENVVSGNANVGLLISNGFNNVVQGNNFGANDPGTAPMPNRYGIYIVGGGNNTIGGGSLVGNVVVSNLQTGLYIANSRRNKIQSNLFGSLGYASGIVGNYNGIYLASGSNNIIGGTASGMGNYINGNANIGLYLGGSGNQVVNNNIGFSDAATVYGNLYGVYVAGSANMVGGSAAGSGNRISGNTLVGLYVAGSGNSVESNTVGTLSASTPYLGNGTGILVTGPGNTIGGTSGNVLNVIAGNFGDGVRVTGNYNVVKSNIIGDYFSSYGFPGNYNGLVITGNYNTIGGPTNAELNFIGSNSHDGIVVDTGVANTLRANYVYNHPNGLGIRLVNGGNAGLQPPAINSAVMGGQLSVSGTVYGPANATITLDFFKSPYPNPSGYGEGQNYLFSWTATTNGSGVGSFSFQYPMYVAPGQYLSATSTTAGAGNTSGFALSVIVTGSLGPGSNGRDPSQLVSAPVAPATVVDLASLGRVAVPTIAPAVPSAGDQANSTPAGGMETTATGIPSADRSATSDAAWGDALFELGW
jgi:parallel beta-helix repeat protein